MSHNLPSERQVDSSSFPSASRSQRTLVMVVSALALVLLLCIGLGVFVLSRNLVGVSKAQADISPLLDTFMQAMVAHDTDRAYQLFSTRAQHHIALRDIEALHTGANYVLFDGYQSLSTTTTSISTIANTDPTIPQGIVATVSGTVLYAGDIHGTFQATLEKEQDTWRLDRIDITVPPRKMLP